MDSLSRPGNDACATIAGFVFQVNVTIQHWLKSFFLPRDLRMEKMGFHADSLAHNFSRFCGPTKEGAEKLWFFEGYGL
jgi:hypothetical protein